MLFNRKNKKERLAIVCDIGSGSVGAGLVLFSENKPPVIVYSVRSPIVFQEKIDFSLFKRSMLSSLEGVVSNVVENGPKGLAGHGVNDKKIWGVFVVLASPWYMAHTKTLSIESPATVEFSKEFVDKNLREEMHKFSRNQKLDEKGRFEQGLELIEHRMIDVKLNGYSLTNPYGKRTQNLDMTLFMSVMSKALKDEIRELLKSFVHVDERDITFHTFAISAYSFIRDRFNRVEDYLIVDVSAEVTDMFICDEGKLISSSSYPYGTNSLLRGLVNSLGVSTSEAKTALRLLEDGDLHPNEEKKINEVIKREKTSWLSLFKEMAKEINYDVRPSKIFIISDKPFEAVFRGFLKEELGAIRSLQKAEIIIMNNAFFNKSIKSSDKADMYIASESYYASKLIGKSS